MDLIQQIFPSKGLLMIGERMTALALPVLMVVDIVVAMVRVAIDWEHMTDMRAGVANVGAGSAAAELVESSNRKPVVAAAVAEVVVGGTEDELVAGSGVAGVEADIGAAPGVAGVAVGDESGTVAAVVVVVDENVACAAAVAGAEDDTVVATAEPETVVPVVAVADAVAAGATPTC